MKKGIISSIIAQLVLMVSCAQPEPPTLQNLTASFVPDTETVYHNPCTGWAIYTDGYIPDSPSAYFSKMKDNGALEYANILYIRLPWAMLEPEEGQYAWEHDENFKELIKRAKENNLRLAFRVYTDNTDYYAQVTPLYVKEAGAEGYTSNTNFWTPYADDPIFLQKLDRFVEAMAKEYNDPAVTDFVDGFGLGKWGEGFNVVCKNPSNQNNVLFTVARSYAKHFSKVICAINAHKSIGNEQLRELANVNDFVFRHDAVGSRKWFESSQSGLMLDFFPRNFTIAESMWWLSQGVGTDLYKGEGFKDWREVLEFTYNEAARVHANILDLRNSEEAKYLWMKLAPDLVRDFNAKAGYRLAPSVIEYPSVINRGEETTITHIWQNLGWGVLPNKNSHWGYKYKVAFALLSKSTGEPVELLIDEDVEPSDWLNSKKKPYHSFLVFNAPAGKYTLAVGIVDTSRRNEIGIQLAVKDQNPAYGGWLPIGNVTVQ